jgi:hypothetical protein
MEPIPDLVLVGVLAAPLSAYRSKLSEVTGGDAASWFEKLFVDDMGAIDGQRGDRTIYFEHCTTGRCVWERPDTAFCDEEGPALLEQEDLMRAHMTAWTESSKLIQSNESTESVDVLRKWLEQKVTDEYYTAFEGNKSMSTTFCEWLITELFASSIARKLDEGSYPATEVDALHALMEDFSRLDQCYLEQARGPCKMDVLHHYVDQKMSESVATLTGGLLQQGRGARKEGGDDAIKAGGQAMGQARQGDGTAAELERAIEIKEEEFKLALEAKDQSHAAQMRAAAMTHAAEMKAKDEAHATEAPAAFWAPLKAKEDEMQVVAAAGMAEAAAVYESAIRAKEQEYESAMAASQEAHAAELTAAVQAHAADRTEAESMAIKYQQLDSAKAELASHHEASQHSVQAAQQHLAAQANGHAAAMKALATAKEREMATALAARGAEHCDALSAALRTADSSAGSELQSAIDVRDREHEQRLAEALAAKDAEHSESLAAKDAEHSESLAAKDAEHSESLAAKDAEHSEAVKAKEEELVSASEMVVSAKEAEYCRSLNLSAAELASVRSRAEELQSKCIESRSEADTLRAQASALRRDLSACSQRLKAATSTKAEGDEQRVQQATSVLRQKLEAAHTESSQHDRREKQWAQRLVEAERSAAAERSSLLQRVEEMQVKGAHVLQFWAMCCLISYLILLTIVFCLEGSCAIESCSSNGVWRRRPQYCARAQWSRFCAGGRKPEKKAA